jgi:hypothetical protein
METTGIVPSLETIEILCLGSFVSWNSSGERIPLEGGRVIATSSSPGIGEVTRKRIAKLTSMTLQSTSNEDE